MEPDRDRPDEQKLPPFHRKVLRSRVSGSLCVEVVATIVRFGLAQLERSARRPNLRWNLVGTAPPRRLRWLERMPVDARDLSWISSGIERLGSTFNVGEELDVERGPNRQVRYRLECDLWRDQPRSA